jgi:hypothetical protein
MGKQFRPDKHEDGGRNGYKVINIISSPNSYILGNNGHVFETDEQGKVIRDISHERFHVREGNVDRNGVVHERMSGLHPPPTAEDLAILRRMGVAKK